MAVQKNEGSPQRNGKIPLGQVHKIVDTLTHVVRPFGLRAWRESIGLSQQQLATAAQISISTLRKYEHAGGWPLSLDATCEVCRYVSNRQM